MSDVTVSNGTKRPSMLSRFRDVQTLAGLGVLVLVWALLQ
jgi:hypothetical protein